MVWQYTPYTIPLSVTAGMVLLSALYVLRNCHTPSSRTGALLLLSNAVWVLGCVLELAGADLRTKVFWNKVQYVGIVVGPTAWIVYAMQYTGRERWLTWRALALLGVVPGALLLLVFTNEAHGLIWSQITLNTTLAPFAVLSKTMGLGFKTLVTYAYLMILLGALLLTPALVRSQQVYPWQTRVLVAAVVAPWLLNAVIDIYDLLPLPRQDLSPLLLGMTAPVVAWSLYHLQQTGIVPVAYRTIFEGMRDGAIVLDPQNCIVDLNPVAQRLIGRAASEIIGQPLARVWPAWSGETNRVGSEISFHKEGAAYTFDVRTSPLLDWRGNLMSQVLVLRDITALKRRAMELATVLEASKAVLSTLDLETVLLLIAKEMVNTIGASGCTLSRWDREADAVVTWVEWRQDWLESSDKSGDSYALKDFPATRAVLETRQPVTIYVSDPDADAAESTYMRETGISSLLMLPLGVGERVIGLVELDHDEGERHFRPDEIRLCQVLADQAAIAIENARLHAETQRRLEEQTALREAGAALSSTLDLQTVLNRIAQQMGQAIEVTSAYICTYEPGTNVVVILAEYIGPQACAQERVSDLGEIFVENDVEFLEIMRAGRHDVSQIDDPDLFEAEREHMQQYGAKSILYIPLQVKGQLIGYTELWESRRRREFTDEEITLCHGLAQQAAIAIENARLFEQAQREIAERKQAEAVLARYAAELERSNQELEQFAYIASHDLQEPLRTVTSYVQLLEMYYKGQLDAAADEYIAFAVDGAARMHALIKGLLDYSRVNTDGAPFRPTDCQVVLDHALADLQASIEESGATVTYDPLPTVMADAAQLGRVFQNLVGNAIKFRSDRPPEIHIGAEGRDGRSAWLFSVRDNGIGIEPEYAEHIFLIFKRLHTRDEYPGTGIGLAMCKRIVERHGGQIWVESHPGQG
jgi:PAS domain S-box-containing protein